MCLRLAQLPDSPAMNSTLSPTSRFGLWFLTGTGVFLAVTAVLKLYSGLLETKVLGAADPLLPFFTVRQMMFLAALLELAVAFVLFRRQHAETAPWLVLWLVGVFTAYRVGLWAVGFQGHCSCMGHVLDFLPGVWLDRLMVASLGVMGSGALVCLSGRRGRAHYWFRQARVLMAICVGFGCAFPGVASATLPAARSPEFEVLDAARKDEKEVGFMARGTLVGYGLEGAAGELKPQAWYQFSFTCSNSFWRLAMISHDTYAASGKLLRGHSAAGSDGEDTYAVGFSTADHVALGLEEGDISPAVPTERLLGTATSGPLPGSQVARFLIIALGFSAPFRNYDLTLLAIDSNAFFGGETRFEASGQTAPDELPERIAFFCTGLVLTDGKLQRLPPPLDKGFKEGEFSVQSRSSVGSLSVPTRFEYLRYRADTHGIDVVPAISSRFEAVVTNLSPITGPTGLPMARTGLQILDYRLRDTNLLISRLTYTLTDSEWLSRTDHRLLRRWTNTVALARLRTPQPASAPPRWVVQGAFGIALLAPVPFVVRHAWRRRRRE